MEEIEVLKNRWSSFDEEDIDIFCKLLSNPDAFDAHFNEYISHVYEDGKIDFDFRGISISHKDIEGGYFAGLDISHGRFRNCKFVKTSFDVSVMSSCQFENCEFIDCSLSGCSIDEGILRNVTIKGSILTSVSMCGGKVEDTKIEQSNLGNADFSSCVMNNISGCDNCLFNTRLPLSQKGNDWWKLTPEERILWS